MILCSGMWIIQLQEENLLIVKCLLTCYPFLNCWSCMYKSMHTTIYRRWCEIIKLFGFCSWIFENIQLGYKDWKIFMPFRSTVYNFLCYFQKNKLLEKLMDRQRLIDVWRAFFRLYKGKAYFISFYFPNSALFFTGIKTTLDLKEKSVLILPVSIWKNSQEV